MPKHVHHSLAATTDWLHRHRLGSCSKGTCRIMICMLISIEVTHLHIKIWEALSQEIHTQRQSHSQTQHTCWKSKGFITFPHSIFRVSRILQYRLKEYSPQSRVRNTGVKWSKLPDGHCVLLRHPTVSSCGTQDGFKIGREYAGGRGQFYLQSWVAKPECPGSTKEGWRTWTLSLGNNWSPF